MMSIASTDYVGLTSTCNDFLQALMDSKLIEFDVPASQESKVQAEKRRLSSARIENVHIVQQILGEDKERSLAEPELRRHKAVIASRSDIEIAGEFVQKYLEDKSLLQEVERASALMSFQVGMPVWTEVSRRKGKTTKDDGIVSEDPGET